MLGQAILRGTTRAAGQDDYVPVDSVYQIDANC